MGNKKRKNSNYVTEKTIKAREELLRAEKRRKIAIIVSISTAIAIAVAMLVVGIVHAVKNSGEDEEPLTITHHASITLEWNDGGTLREDNIHIELYGENAPITVENFVTLINEGYYNGLNLDKIMKNDKDNDDLFYISGGTSDEPANTIKGEFEENDVENTIPHKKGTIYMHHDEFDNDKNISNNNTREYSAGLNYYIKGQALRLILNYVFCQNQAGQDSHRIMLGTQIAI